MRKIRLVSRQFEGRQTLNTRWLRPVLLVGVSVSCGGSVKSIDGVSSGGSANSHGDGSGGRSSGGSGGMQDVSSGGGRTTETSGGGAQVGGDGSGGELQGSGGHGAEGGSRGGAGGSRGGAGGGEGNESGGTGGEVGSGGSAGEVVLGDPCSVPGTLSCSDANAVLSLICGAEKTWEQSEVCSGGDFCFNGDSELAGTCQAPDSECEDVPNKKYCDQEGYLVSCDAEGVFSTRDECAVGCDQDVCIGQPPECPDSEQIFDFKRECSDEGNLGSCISTDVMVVPSEWRNTDIHLRIPAVNELCRSPSCDRPAFALWLGIDWQYTIEVPQGWGIYLGPVGFDAPEEGIPCGDEIELVEGCVRSNSGFAYLVPLENGLGETFMRIGAYTSGFDGEKFCNPTETL